MVIFSVYPSVRQPEITTESDEHEPFFTVMCSVAEMEPSTTRYYVQWQLGHQTLNITEPLGDDARSTLTAEDIEGLQMGDEVSSLIYHVHAHNYVQHACSPPCETDGKCGEFTDLSVSCPDV